MSNRLLAAIGAVLALAGAACAAWGLVYLAGALSPDNSTNELREIGVAFGTGVIAVGSVPAICGVAMVIVAARRRRGGTVDAHRP